MRLPGARAVDMAGALSLSVVVWSVGAWAASGASASEAVAAPRAVACAFAVEVDGVLRCDAEAPRDLAALCGREGPRLRHGDAVARASVCAAASPRPGAPGWGRLSGEDLAALGVPVDLNTASGAELESLPGVGPALARAIAGGRPYARVEELLRVPGIGPARLAGLRARARVSEGAGGQAGR